jgi:CheY-like chemotaxis protein
LLLVCDNAADAQFIQQAFAQGKLPSHVTVAPDATEAMHFLSRETPRFVSAPRPDLILLDLKLGGAEAFLGDLKSQPGLLRIPVMVLSGSASADDLERVYSLHANCYIRKPVDPAGFAAVVRSIEEFWLRTVTLPNR